VIENHFVKALIVLFQTDNGENLPLWFVFSGMGSQCTGMGKDLMRLPLFRETIERCHEVLLPKGLNLIEILTTSDETIFDDILNSFVGIAAVQVGQDPLAGSLFFPCKTYLCFSSPFIVSRTGNARISTLKKCSCRFSNSV